MGAGIAVPFAPAATTAGCGGAVVVPVLKRFLSFGRERGKELLVLMGLLVVVVVMVLLVKAAVAKVVMSVLSGARKELLRDFPYLDLAIQARFCLVYAVAIEVCW